MAEFKYKVGDRVRVTPEALDGVGPKGIGTIMAIYPKNPSYYLSAHWPYTVRFAELEDDGLFAENELEVAE